MEKRKTFAEIEAEIAGLMETPREKLSQEELETRGLYAEALACQERQKVDAFARFTRMEEARARHLREEAARLTARARNIEANIRWLKGVYLGVMQSQGRERVEGEAYSIRRQRHKYVLITDEKALDPDFVRTETTVSPDKQLIRDAIENGVQVDGAVLGESETVVIS